MERVFDKLILLIISAFLATSLPFTALCIVAALATISITALFDVDSVPKALRIGLLIAYCAVSLLSVEFIVYLPLIAYDCFRSNRLTTNLGIDLKTTLRFIWGIPLIFGLARISPLRIIVIAVLGILACLRAWQSNVLIDTLAEYRRRRDELSAAQQSLEAKNRNLEEIQTLELRLATMAERSRIAREIHDNVGHLLTRSVLQVEALQITRASDEQLTEQLKSVKVTLQEAYESVRQSVHGLHEEAFDLHLQLLSLVHETEGVESADKPDASWEQRGRTSPLKIELDYELQTDSPAQAISYSILAIVREALSNTMKHSDATSVKISLIEFPGFYQLIVHDNGSAEPSQATLSSGGMGLSSMEERTRALGGVFNTSWDRGFKVFASIPK